ncbi:alcohol dehydrogenase superfamily protein [Stachybotrys elegans]|uniref:Alcohol dehydrogenase superfamily protein n=1 Tax=Stachybotrys elegans TaxID=80388 RepID=A0A8K0SL87_9HYPO|nr:alcohol dehydrogenase superfamily protein [Stachybotrys elegans]
MSTHKVIRVTSKTKGPSGLQSFEEPIPTISQDEILVRVRGATLNFRDLAITTGQYPLKTLDNVVPGSDVAGEVVQVGARVTTFSVGDRVVAPISFDFQYGVVTEEVHHTALGGGRDGALAEYTVMPAYGAMKLPKSSHDFIQWAALVTAGGTAWNCLYGCNPLRAGQTVLCSGTGGVSLAAMVFAKAAGAITIVTSSSDEKLKHVQDAYGAQHLINYKTTPNWADEVLRITGGEGAHHVIEIGGGGTIMQSAKAVARGGVISLVGFLHPDSEDKIHDLVMGIMLRGSIVRGVLGASKQQLEDAIDCMAKLQLQMPIDKVFGFTQEEVVAAYEHLAAGKQIGKIGINLG